MDIKGGSTGLNSVMCCNKWTIHFFLREPRALKCKDLDFYFGPFRKICQGRIRAKRDEYRDNDDREVLANPVFLLSCVLGRLPEFEHKRFVGFH